MTKDEIDRMTREADACHDNVQVTPFLERFAALIAAAAKAEEREACAKVCDEADKDSDWPTAANCAAAIRARGQA